MIKGARKLPMQHFTIRVPWHDSGWQGTICNNCVANTSCTILPRIAVARDDIFEIENAGKSLEDLSEEQRPPCVDEHVSFMANFPLPMVKKHPYATNSPDTHGHFDETGFLIRPFSAAAIPFRWMLREQVVGSSIVGKGLKENLRIEFQDEREPDLAFSKTWVQEGANQRIILDTFFSSAVPDESLVFFYAKRTPLIDDHRRIIVGVGRIKSIGAPVEYKYKNGVKPADKISGFLWERNIEHSIRQSESDGFLLPYQELLKAAELDDSIDPAECAAFAPDEYFAGFSFGSEHLAHDGAISSLLNIEKSIKAMSKHLPSVPWERYLKWIDVELNRLWQVRGAYPGLGAALNAFGFTHGNLLAWYLESMQEESFDPWKMLSTILLNPETLPDYLRERIGSTFKELWKQLSDERRALLQMLARFNLTDTQALRWYQPTEREKAGIFLTDAEILKNPYLIYEDDRLQEDPVAFQIIDRGIFPPEAIRKDFPISEPSLVTETIDSRRVRALMILTLEEAARDEGHTYLPANWLVQRIRERVLQIECPLDFDKLSIINNLTPKITKVALEAQHAYQLQHYVEISELIRTKISKRKNGKMIQGDHNWNHLVQQVINTSLNVNYAPNERDKKARNEKASALKIIYQSRVSVLMGAAGTGKSTLLKALCNIQSVKDGGILLLAPTGKARVRAEQTTGLHGQGLTIAQFLNKLDRYDGKTGRYFINNHGMRSSNHKTVIIDECSMLTEEQIAALLDAVEQVDRLVLVGDPKQLPPIGAGRPYVDIIRFLKPENIENIWPRVGASYAELTVTMRQSQDTNATRDDVLFAQSFSGQPYDIAAEEIWEKIAKGKSEIIKLSKWNSSDQVFNLLLEAFKNEISLNGNDDEIVFEESLGGVRSNFNETTTVFFNTEYKNRPGAARMAESWQVLSPVKQLQAGVVAINRAIQQHFRKNFLNIANTANRRIIPRPMGPEGIIYGDKVINVVNSSRRATYPEKEDAYVANGDIGIVTGHRRTRIRNFTPHEIEVEFATQPGFSYKYRSWEFDSQESSPPLELAYALTVHKTQGSEYGTTFVVIPNQCRNLSREMLYTALTRHKNKIVILHQGDFKELRQYGLELASEINRRMTNLFHFAKPAEIKVKNKNVFLDSNLVYLTENHELVRSKSEWIIADKLKAAGIKYQYEQPLMLDGIERYPDFTIYDDDSGMVWYWEHNGMLSDSEYEQRWKRKEAAYIRAGIKPLSLQKPNDDTLATLLVTSETNGAGLDLNAINANINLILGFK